MKQNKDRAIAWIIKQEVDPGHELDGSYHCAKDDKGGCTKFGIATASHPDTELIARFGHGLKDLTRDEAIILYDEGYWQKIDGDFLETGLDLEVLDFSVTSGPVRAVKFLEWAMVGNVTGDALVDAYASRRQNFYKNIAAKDPTQTANLHDWLVRINQTLAEAKRWRANETNEGVG